MKEIGRGNDRQKDAHRSQEPSKRNGGSLVILDAGSRTQISCVGVVVVNTTMRADARRCFPAQSSAIPDAGSRTQISRVGVVVVNTTMGADT